jgi:hypothetical protein
MRRWLSVAAVLVVLTGSMLTSVPQAFALPIYVGELPSASWFESAGAMPEPASLMLIGVGILVVGVIIRRRVRPQPVKID